MMIVYPVAFIFHLYKLQWYKSHGSQSELFINPSLYCTYTAEKIIFAFTLSLLRRFQTIVHALF